MKPLELKEFRKKHKLGQKEAAKLMGVGLSMVQKYESGEYSIPDDRAELLKLRVKEHSGYVNGSSSETLLSLLNELSGDDEIKNRIADRYERLKLKFDALNEKHIELHEKHDELKDIVLKYVEKNAPGKNKQSV